MFVLPLLVLLFALGGVSGVCGEIRISTVNDFIEFSNNVNKGTNYLGTAVFLDSDIDLSGKTFELIGNSDSNGFRGTFDGQGHTISNLVINSGSQYAGLFGYSKGTTIKNVVMDSSCSVTNSYALAGIPSVGVIIGYCSAESNMCTIENTVNMGSVTFKGNASGQYSYLGGIAGYLSSTSDYEVNIKNCVNYGSVSHTGSSWFLRLGGIIGFSSGKSSQPILIQNCLNYGELSSNNIVSDGQSIGGIAGNTYATTIENCVSVGRIISNKIKYPVVGGIVGNVQLNTAITHCIWTSDVGYDNASGAETSATMDYSLINALNTTTINELNEYAEKKDSTWSRWVILRLNGGSIKNLNHNTPIAGLVKSLPVPEKEGNEFLFWCIDEGCNEKYDPDETSTSRITDLYALWAYGYFITFNFNNGTTKSIEFKYNEVIVYPEDMKREGYAFKGWSPMPVRMPAKNITVAAQWTINSYTVVFNFNNGTTKRVWFKYNETIAYPEDMEREGYTFGWDPKPVRMPAKNITVTAQWIINNYTVTFNFNNGTESEVKIFEFNETIAYPANATREGYTFKGWSPMPERMPAKNITIWAQWNEVSEYVEIVFSTKDLNEEKAKEIVEKYTGAEFTIAKFEIDENEIKVIIKFVDVEEATNFIETVSSSSDVKKRVIKNVGFIRDLNSFSSPLNLFTFAYFLF